MSQTFPIVPRAPKAPPRRSLERAAFSAFLSLGARAHQRSADSFCQALYPDDRTALAILNRDTRAAVTAATTTTAGWASELVAVAVGEFVSTLPSSAAAVLISRGMQITFPPGAGSVKIPDRLAGPTAAPWVAENVEIPARAWVLSGATLAPKKIGLLVAFTQELANHSFAETIFRQMLAEEATYSLDAAYFGTTSPAAGLPGLLNGVTPTTITGSAGGAPSDVMRDLGVLAAAVNSQAGASGEVMFVMGPAMRAQAAPAEPFYEGKMFASAAVPDNRVIAIDPKSIAHAFGDAVIDSSIHSTIHMSDTPLPIGTAPNVVASPSVSLFQQAMIALRMLIDVAFVKRRSGAVAYADSRDWSP